MKIIVIGCPGSGKSVLVKRLNEILNLPVLHLDKIYHTDGKTHLSREMLVKKVNEFANQHESWIIDGNYSSTMEQRVKLSDTIILLDIPTDDCLYNAHKRANERIGHKINWDDMAEGFDFTMTQDFISYIRNFKEETLPGMLNIIEKNKKKDTNI